MSDTLISTILSLSGIGVAAAIVLYLIAQKFKVHEDPKIDEVEEVLPAANCGGCGYAGCRNFAEACVKAEDLSDLYCPVGGQECMDSIAKVLGLETVKQTPKVAVVRCNGTYMHCAKTNHYEGAPSCAVASQLYGGETGCQYGCLGLGDCVAVCPFDAIAMDADTGLPIVDDEKCTACGACVVACPRHLIELRKKNPKDRKIYVSCMNHDKGGVARKICSVACIGCSRCVKECPFDAITIDNFLAYIDPEKCKLCRKCVSVCPTHAIQEINFPAKKSNTQTITETKST
jgi:Na+-translocating ferredoxin:NAD+ oxidoreductase RNF subunit RnfB